MKLPFLLFAFLLSSFSILSAQSFLKTYDGLDRRCMVTATGLTTDSNVVYVGRCENADADGRNLAWFEVYDAAGEFLHQGEIASSTSGNVYPQNVHPMPDGGFLVGISDGGCFGAPLDHSSIPNI